MTKTDQSELSKKILGVFARYGVIAEKPGAAKALVELFSQHAECTGGEHAENLAEVANWVENQGCPEEANQLRAAAARIAELEGVLKTVEWAGDKTAPVCPVCRANRWELSPHDPNCRLSAALYRRAGEVIDGK